MTNKSCNEEVSKACTSILLRSCDEEFRHKYYRLLMVPDTPTAYDVLREKVQDLLVGKVNNNRLQQLDSKTEVVSKKIKVVQEQTDVQTPSSSEDSIHNSEESQIPSISEELEFFNLDVWSEK